MCYNAFVTSNIICVRKEIEIGLIMRKDIIYLDAAATAEYKPTDDTIIETMANAMKDCWMNPSSL